MEMIRRPRAKVYLVIGGVILISLLISAFVLPQFFREELVDAPETDRVLLAQQNLLFQILIPAYLPDGFERESVDIQAELTGPDGQAMVQLIYNHPLGVTLTLSEYLLPEPVAASQASEANPIETNIQMCTCMCKDSVQCSTNQLMVDVGPVHIMGETSDPLTLSAEHVRVILSTLAPASGLLTYTTLDDVPLAAGLPPAEEVPVNESGVQELVLVVTPSGYTPVHFSVQKGIPVRLIFRQLGEVGCGNELYVEWSSRETGYLILANASDSQVLEFTPPDAGEFLLHCSHYIFQGVMTVVD